MATFSCSALCRGSCFLSYTAENSHHLMAAIIPQKAPCQEENITSTPPPPPTWGVAKLSCQNAKMGCQIEAPSWGGGGGQIRHFSNKSTTKQYFKKLISHKRRVFLALSSLQCQSSPISFPRAVKRESVAYIVKLSL
jgi:hypothetical protein